ncbi:MAG: hypothetical protein JNL50_03565 [Phycisphaerae bacterium]|nr:hypothetical protein [Phycisphaerae bacterium]
MKSVASAVIVSAVFCASASAQLSELYLNRHGDGSGKIYVVQGGAIVREWMGERGSLFVTGSVVRTAGNTGGAGAEYTLAGVATGNTYPAPGTAGMHNDDSTTDGVYAYGLNYNSQRVVRFDLDWSNPTNLFGVGGNSDGITWDRTDNTLWTCGWTTGEINHYSMAGAWLGGFVLPTSGHVGIAIDPADHTLWMNKWGTNQIEQYSVTGTHLQTLTVSGLPGDLSGAEFAIPTPGAGVLVGVGGLAAMRRRRA